MSGDLAGLDRRELEAIVDGRFVRLGDRLNDLLAAARERDKLYSQDEEESARKRCAFQTAARKKLWDIAMRVLDTASHRIRGYLDINMTTQVLAVRLEAYHLYFKFYLDEESLLVIYDSWCTSATEDFDGGDVLHSRKLSDLEALTQEWCEDCVVESLEKFNRCRPLLTKQRPKTPPLKKDTELGRIEILLEKTLGLLERHLR